MRPMDADKNGAGLGLPVLVALCGSLLGRNTRGGSQMTSGLASALSFIRMPRTRFSSRWWNSGSPSAHDLAILFCDERFVRGAAAG
jgi:hypothetical protein